MNKNMGIKDFFKKVNEVIPFKEKKVEIINSGSYHDALGKK